MSSTVTKNEVILKNLKADLNKTKTELMEIREAETYVHSFNAIYQGTAQQIAEKVNQHFPAHNWYTTNVTFDTPSTFWTNEKNLVSEYIRIKNIELEAPVDYDQFDYPSIATNVGLNLIPDTIKEENQLKASFKLLQTLELEELQKSITNLSEEERLSFKNELQKLKELQRPLLFNSYPALKNVIDDIFTNRGFVWEEIVQKSSLHLQTIEDFKDQFDDQLINIGGLTTVVAKKMAEDLHAHVETGGNLGNFLIKPKVVRQYKDQLQEVTYNRLPIKSDESVTVLLAYAQTNYAQEQLQQLLVPALLSQANPTFSEVQNALAQLSKALHIQEWRNNLLHKHSFLSIDDFNEKMVEALIQNIDILELRNNILSKSTFLEEVIQKLNDYSDRTNTPIVSRINKFDPSS